MQNIILNTDCLVNHKLNLSSPSILLVEDNELIRLIHQRMLEKLGYQVTAVENGKNAIDYSAKDHYSAMVLDLGLPDIMGEEVISVIRMREMNTLKHLPIIVATAHGDAETLKACKKRGADAAFVKPLSSILLADTLTQVC